MFQKIIHFIKYHNAFTIGLFLVFAFTGVIFASENARDAVIGEKIITEQGIDNSQLISANLNTFDLAMTIINVTEDTSNYYVDYQFKTLGVENNVWQDTLRQNQMTISKEALSGHDLGLYVQEQLSQIAGNELAFLKEVQNNEKKKGETQIAKTTEYTGLIGLVLNIKDKILPGYEPIIKPVDIAPQYAEETAPVQESLESQTQTETSKSPVVVFTSNVNTPEEAVFTFSASDSSATFQCKINSLDYETCTSPKTYPGLIPGEYTFQLIGTNDFGSSDPASTTFSWTITESAPVPEPEPVCDAENKDLCTTQELCEGVSLYWYNDVCNLDPVMEP